MNTPAHLIFGAAAFAKPGHKRVTLAAILGSLAPDISLYLMASWSIMVSGVNPQIVFNEYYYSPSWQQVFAVDNSFVLWGLGLGIALWARRPAWIAFAGAGVLHLAFDFPVHNHDARMHFWPISNWTFISPFSYWDSRFHAGFVSKVEIGLALALAVLLLGRFKRLGSRVLIVLVAVAETIATGAFGAIF
ncbi:MAG: cobalamin biosynthesis protein CobQ [Paracoccaceae bacterium]